MCRLSWNLGASTSWNPQGLSRPVMGLLYLYLLLVDRTLQHENMPNSFLWGWDSTVSMTRLDDPSLKSTPPMYCIYHSVSPTTVFSDLQWCQPVLSLYSSIRFHTATAPHPLTTQYQLHLAVCVQAEFVHGKGTYMTLIQNIVFKKQWKSQARCVTPTQQEC